MLINSYVISTIKEYPRVCEKVGDDYKNISLHTTRKGNYGIFYKETFTGLFLVKEYLDKNDIKQFTVIDDKFI